ncbi:MAG: branched-chain amino acid ABC transporter permease [bacterium]
MDMKRDYYEDVQFLNSTAKTVWFGLLMIALCGFPFIASDYAIYIVNYIAINVIVVLGLNLLVGYTGQVSLGHAGFMAIGAYATVLLMIRLHVPFLLALPAAGLLSAAFGFLLALPALRLEGPYLAIATLGFGLALTQIIGRVQLFGGHMGVQAPEWALGSWTINTSLERYFVIIFFAVVLALVMRNMVHLRLGRAFVAIRDNDIAAAVMGVNVSYYKTLAFATSAFYAGVAGGLWAFVLGYINPGMFNLVLSVLFLAMVVVGGAGSVLGSILGAAVVSFLSLKLEAVQTIPWLGDSLRFLSRKWMSESGLPNVSFVFLGLILMAIVIFEPLGLYGIWMRIKRYWRTWPF